MTGGRKGRLLSVMGLTVGGSTEGVVLGREFPEPVLTTHLTNVV
jgi:hypothetical protein